MSQPAPPSSPVVSNVSVLAYCYHTIGPGFTFWHFRGPAWSLAEIRAPGFMDDAADMLAAGDMMALSASDGGTVVVVAKVDGRPRLFPLAW